MNNSVVDPGAVCAHPVVKRLTEVLGTYYVDVWECDFCRRRYTLLPEVPLGKATLMAIPETVTLRDQFAIAAMQADALQSAIIAAAYIAQGKRFDGDVPNLAHGIEEYYQTADAMMKARATQREQS